MEVGGLDADDSLSHGYRGGDDGDEPGGRLGIAVEEAPDDMLSRWDLSGGVLVRGVQPDSPADDGGLRPGDVITAVGSTPIRSVEDFQDIIAKLDPGDSVPLRLMRRGSPLFIGIRLGEG